MSEPIKPQLFMPLLVQAVRGHHPEAFAGLEEQLCFDDLALSLVVALCPTCNAVMHSHRQVLTELRDSLLQRVARQVYGAQDAEPDSAYFGWDDCRRVVIDEFERVGVKT